MTETESRRVTDYDRARVVIARLEQMPVDEARRVIDRWVAEERRLARRRQGGGAL